ncbi:RNA-binding protein Musashi like protein Rbp6 [Trachymyrmex septentrionalis]|uniref:RNA-binding protein Musashi like protein Rbp6 n=1 Tax=Trachymyrmex septentrionalis TaxID=34720 RepID=A0A195FN45_9HYME|nr:RNA-binding protein Musashi like protein Rbp6 [Trachymyrmex septentrionalis]
MRGTKGICVCVCVCVYVCVCVCMYVCVEGRRSQGNPEEGDFVVRAPKGSITKMIGSAIGGDGNCVNRVIITNLEAISSRPDQSEDAPPFPEQGPFLFFLVSDLTLPTIECHGITSSRHVKFRVTSVSPSYANVTRSESYVDLALVRMGGTPSSCLAQRSPSMADSRTILKNIFAIYIIKEKDYCTKEVIPVLFTLPYLLFELKGNITGIKTRFHILEHLINHFYSTFKYFMYTNQDKRDFNGTVNASSKCEKGDADERKRRRTESGTVEEGEILETLPAGPGAVAPRERMKELRVGTATGIRRSAGRAKGERGEEYAGRIDGRGGGGGFGFITFADPASVDKVLAQGNHELDGKKVSNHHILPD